MSAFVVTQDCSFSNVVGAKCRFVSIFDFVKTNTTVGWLRHVLSASQPRLLHVELGSGLRARKMRKIGADF